MPIQRKLKLTLTLNITDSCIANSTNNIGINNDMIGYKIIIAVNSKKVLSISKRNLMEGNTNKNRGLAWGLSLGPRAA